MKAAEKELDRNAFTSDNGSSFYWTFDKWWSFLTPEWG